MCKIKFYMLVLILSITCILFYNCNRIENNLEHYENMVSIKQEIQTSSFISNTQNAKQVGIELPAMLLWDKEETNISGYMDRQESIQAIKYIGDISILLDSDFLNGTVPIDNYGCIIDQAIAESILGSEQVLGQKIEYNNNEYYISGIIKGTNKTAYFPIEEDTMLSNLLIDMSKEKTGIYGAELVLQQINFPNSESYDYGLLVWILKVVNRLPVFVLLVNFIAVCIFLWRKISRISFLSIVTILCLSVFSLILAICGQFVFLPERLIPTKWSDFDFWSDKSEQISNCFLHFFKNSSSNWEIDFFISIFVAVLFAIITTLLIISLLRPLKQTDKPIFICIFWWVINLIMVIKNKNSSVPDFFVWNTIPVFVFMNLILRCY